MIKKNYIYKCYDVARSYLGTLDPRMIVSVPQFQWSVNAGQGNVTVEFATPLDSTDIRFLIKGELPTGETVTLWDSFSWDVDTWDTSGAIGTEVHSVDIVCVDDDDPSGKIIFSGVVKKINQSLSAGGDQSLSWELFSWITEATTAIYEDAGGNTTIQFTSEDPANMFKDVIDRLNAKKDYFTYDTDSIQLTNTEITYDFKFVTCKEALDRILELCPDNWLYYLDADRKFHLFKGDSGGFDHVINLGVEANEYQGSLDRSNIINTVYFNGGDDGGGSNVYKRYARAASISAYNDQETLMSDNRVTVDATTEYKANKVLNEQEEPTKEININVLDNGVGFSGLKGYDIESFLPGDSIIVRHPNIGADMTLWDSFMWDLDEWDGDNTTLLGIPMYITDINYTPLNCGLTLKTKLPTFEKRMEDVERNNKDLLSINIPDAPT